ncbi:hypothetical protein NQ317_018819 [Molorchus minor]|uniref:DUF5641 domain-containing protein n=1 Tax=Molorchus minor TaxID=1323400 RepID=A0ABQ9JR99_9CUCU|nr:hypothetical protein NQ317_018819 [Molorchus minor]
MVTWPESIFDIIQEDLPEIRNNIKVLVATKMEGFPFKRFSSFIRLKRTVAYMLRFKHNCFSSKNILPKQCGPLSVDEIAKAHVTLVKLAQSDSFPCELKDLLKNGRITDRKSNILSLSPFIDKEGVIRVGGRLKHSSFSYDKKHPISLCPKHHMTQLIFRYEHLSLYHAGPQALFYSVREKYWPVAGRKLAHKTLIQNVQQHFWQRWQKAYISELQQRCKWKQAQASLKLNDLVVLIKEDNIPPKQWKLGRICKLFPGRDCVCRVADVKTASGILRRAFSKLCIVPVENDD